MRLRRLEQRDANLMLEWMHDETVAGKLHTDFASKTIEDCRRFITNSCDEKNLHLAIVNDDDTYIGTISLKHITNDDAEFAITICSEAMGRGYAILAMQQMLNIGFKEYGLKRIYWCVSPENKRAVRFYEKHGYGVFDILENEELLSEIYKGRYTKEEVLNYKWFAIDKDKLDINESV